MKEEWVVIQENVEVAKDTYRMRLKGEISKLFSPGQFVNVLIDGYTLRRPISVSQYDAKTSTFVLLYKVMGEGTKKMSKMRVGETLSVFGPLGNGFPIEASSSVLLIGGGAGAGPLVQVAKELRGKAGDIIVVLGFPTKEDVYALEDFREIGIEVLVSTDDGTMGTKGNVLDLIEEKGISAEIVYACGPKRMLRGIEERFTKGYISLDVRMACGMGACMACVCKDQKEEEKYYRVCKEGPVFEIGQVIIE